MGRVLLYNVAGMWEVWLNEVVGGAVSVTCLHSRDEHCGYSLPEEGV